MCGIFGYIGSRDAAEVVTTGLKRLEYRGYDSWGIALLSQKLILEKHIGSIGDTTFNPAFSALNSNVGIGHTRWATHGMVSEKNAHPHLSSDKSFALAQNGIVENYTELKDSLLKKGYKFTTETDTEVIVKLIEDKLKKAVLLEAVRLAFLDLKGRNTIILISKDGQIIACRNGSPLIIGKNFDTDEIYLSSDTLSFAPFAKKIIVIDNGQMVAIQDKQIKIYNLNSAKVIKRAFEDIGFKAQKIDKGGFPHFMIKEIYESPDVIGQLITQDRKALENFSKVLKKSKNIYTIGSGTIGAAAAQIAFYLRSIGKINATALIGSDAVEYLPLFGKGDLIISPSQSGETADVLAVLEKTKLKGVKIASIVNMPGSSMTRLSDFKFMMEAGPEICVMSTKAFTFPIAWGYLLSKTIQGKYHDGVKKLVILKTLMGRWLQDKNRQSQIKKMAKELSKSKDIFLLGKYQNFQIIKEGMIKLIEGTYKHAHALPAGDLKHYVITLVEKGTPVIAVVSEDQVKADVLNAIHEVKARGAKIVALASKNHPDYDIFIEVPDCGEPTAIMNTIPLQLLAYYMALELGNNIDKPRNIAKSVTVT